MLLPLNTSIISFRRLSVMARRVLGGSLVNVGVKQIVLQVDFLNEHFGVEQVSLVYVNIHRVVPLEGLRVDVVLNGGDLMVHEQLFLSDIRVKPLTR